MKMDMVNASRERLMMSGETRTERVEDHSILYR